MLRAVMVGLTLLSGCSSTQLMVRDQGTGAPVINARAVQLSGTDEHELASANSAGRLAFALPSAPDAIVAVRAQGFIQWSKTVAWVQAQPQPLTINLEPVWMGRFLQTGKKPSEIVTPTGCRCPHKKVQ